MDSVKKHVIIVAAGKGSRIGTEIPKQFLVFEGKPLLYYTIMAFSYLKNTDLTIVLNEDFVSHWNEISSHFNIKPEYNIAIGGPTRFHSVKSALKFVENNQLVLVHDAARPFPSEDTINRVIETTLRKGNAIPVIDIVDTVREVSGPFSRQLNRDMIKVVQTPQGFMGNIIKEAYNQPYNTKFTDDAIVAESKNYSINIVNGNVDNIKISNKTDLIVAEHLIKLM